MKYFENGIRLAQANAPIRKELKAKEKVWIHVSQDALDELVRKYPTSYLGILETWQEALYNQTLYCVEGNVVRLVGVYVDGRTPKFVYFQCSSKFGRLFITEASNGRPTQANWKYVKKDSRKK